MNRPVPFLFSASLEFHLEQLFPSVHAAEQKHGDSQQSCRVEAHAVRSLKTEMCHPQLIVAMKLHHQAQYWHSLCLVFHKARVHFNKKEMLSHLVCFYKINFHPQHFFWVHYYHCFSKQQTNKQTNNNKNNECPL
jgi:hypothetical protein